MMLLVISLSGWAQTTRTGTEFGLEPGQTSVMEIGLGYLYFHANAPPAQCGCFSLNGGGGNLVINMPHGFSVVADLTGTHANRVNATTQNISIFLPNDEPSCALW